MTTLEEKFPEREIEMRCACGRRWKQIVPAGSIYGGLALCSNCEVCSSTTFIEEKFVCKACGVEGVITLPEKCDVFTGVCAIEDEHQHLSPGCKAGISQIHVFNDELNCGPLA